MGSKPNYGPVGGRGGYNQQQHQPSHSEFHQPPLYSPTRYHHYLSSSGGSLAYFSVTSELALDDERTTWTESSADGLWAHQPDLLGATSWPTGWRGWFSLCPPAFISVLCIRLGIIWILSNYLTDGVSDPYPLGFAFFSLPGS